MFGRTLYALKAAILSFKLQISLPKPLNRIISPPKPQQFSSKSLCIKYTQVNCNQGVTSIIGIKSITLPGRIRSISVPNGNIMGIPTFFKIFFLSRFSVPLLLAPHIFWDKPALWRHLIDFEF